MMVIFHSFPHTWICTLWENFTSFPLVCLFFKLPPVQISLHLFVALSELCLLFSFSCISHSLNPRLHETTLCWEIRSKWIHKWGIFFFLPLFRLFLVAVISLVIFLHESWARRSFSILIDSERDTDHCFNCSLQPLPCCERRKGWNDSLCI